MNRRPHLAGCFLPDSVLFKSISLFLVWAMAMTSLPAYAAPRSDQWSTAWSSISAAYEQNAIAQLMKELRFRRRTTASPVVARALVPPVQSRGLEVFAGFADSSSPNANFPTPWQGAPNTIFIGGGSPVTAGALRIDNTSGTPLTIDSVAVDLQRGNAQFNLWGSFTIPASGSAILTQTQPGNFDTSAFPIVPCGGTLASGETRIPTITVTIAGTPQTFVDTAHVLDTGGFDLSCRGNESLQWRPIGTSGIDHPTGLLTLQPGNATGSGGSPITTAAQL